MFVRITLLVGIGKSLQAPCLQEGQLLDGSRVGRIFAQKVIWLRPTEDLSSLENSRNNEGQGNIEQEENIQTVEDDQYLITDLLPVSYLLPF